MYSTVSRVGESQCIFTIPPVTNGVSSHFTTEPLPSVASTFFLHKSPPNPLQKINKIENSTIFSLTGTPHNRCTINRPWCSSLNGIKVLTKLFINNFLFWWSPHFSAFETTNKNLSERYMQNHPKKVHAISTTLHPSPFLKTSPRDILTQSLVTNFVSFNPSQYESNHLKQDLLITTSTISHCLLQL